LCLLTSIHLPALVDLIGEECVYGRYSLDTHALECDQVTRFVHRHLIFMRGAPLPPYCRTLLLFVARQLLGGVLSRKSRKFRSFAATARVAIQTFDILNFFDPIVQELNIH
jgi:hypothetical protein